MINLTLSHLRSQELPSFPHVSTASYSFFLATSESERATCMLRKVLKKLRVTKILYYIFIQKCSKICKSLFHFAKRTEVCTCHDRNSSIPLSHKIKHSIQKRDFLKQVYVPSTEKMSTFCVVMWINTNLVCKMFVTCFFIP